MSGVFICVCAITVSLAVAYIFVTKDGDDDK